MIPISGLLPEQLGDTLGLPQKFRARQIFRWLHARGVTEFSRMSDLPEDLRRELAGRAQTLTLRPDGELRDPDGTVKSRFRLPDGAAIESVLLRDERGRLTACLSSQVGCAMGCLFCRTGAMGLLRNLEPHEMVEQFLLLRRHSAEIDNVVFMGMGEPLANLDHLRRAVDVLTAREGCGLAPRRITVSTCGLIGGIARLAAQGPRVRLAVTLIAADQALREKLMPVARANPLPELRRALLDYQRATGKRFTLEVVLMEGINDGSEDARALVEFLRSEGPPLKALVNLIPWNPVPGLSYRRPAPERVTRFQRMLSQAGVPVATRLARGVSVAGACGQLATA
jgi:23S rRNA (adenine2503-C2)-methyltransferase